MKGAYNATTAWCTNEDMTKAIAKALHKPLWLPSVPSFILQIILGEMADMVLEGSRVSPEKIKRAGYRYQFVDLEDALNNLLK
jgi:NAD dependent epimerase/dehydratase family enzyme